MHAGKTYKLGEFLFWTRRSIFSLLVLSIIPAALYQLLDLKWLGIPFTIIALLGTGSAFIITFRNQQTYNRTWEARQIWGATMSASRSWVMMYRDFLGNADQSRELIHRGDSIIKSAKQDTEKIVRGRIIGNFHIPEYAPAQGI